MSIELHRYYTVATVAYMAGIYGLSSVPGAGAGGSSIPGHGGANLFHLPLYAGLAFCWVQALSGGRAWRALAWPALLFTVMGAGAYAAFDEWHQSLVPGRNASLGDLVLDLLGIFATLAVLLVFRLRQFTASVHIRFRSRAWRG